LGAEKKKGELVSGFNCVCKTQRAMMTGGTDSRGEEGGKGHTKSVGKSRALVGGKGDTWGNVGERPCNGGF